MTIEQFLAECMGHAYDVGIFLEFPCSWAISVNEWSPSMPGPTPRRRYATGNTWAEALAAWRQTDWVDREMAMTLLFGTMNEAGV